MSAILGKLGKSYVKEKVTWQSYVKSNRILLFIKSVFLGFTHFLYMVRVLENCWFIPMACLDNSLFNETKKLLFGYSHSLGIN